MESREALGAALGSPVAMSPPGGLDLDQFEAAVARTCHLNDDIDCRPDVAAARGQVDIAERKVHEAELLFSPTLGLASEFADNNVAVLGPVRTWLSRESSTFRSTTAAPATARSATRAPRPSKRARTSSRRGSTRSSVRRKRIAWWGCGKTPARSRSARSN